MTTMLDSTPTPDAVVAEPAGRALDVWVAVHVLGWTFKGEWKIRGLDVPDRTEPFGIPPGEQREDVVPWFSVDIKDAWTVVERLTRWMFDVQWGFFDSHCIGDWQPLHLNLSAAGYKVRFGSHATMAETMPLTVCRAALLAVLAERAGKP